jgi:type IV pilus assembly protein PilM
MKTKLFYHRRPMFGLDIGSQSVKAMQLDTRGKKSTVLAYGSTSTDEKIMKGGVVTDVPAAAKLVDNLLAKEFNGTLTTNRVVMSVPVSRVFTRVLNLPAMSKKELDSAVKLEVDQSVPVPSKDLYYDYEATETADPKNVMVRMVAVPKSIIDSYTSVCDLLGLDLAMVQTNIQADAQLCLLYEDISGKNPYIIVDVGGNSIDVGMLDETLRVTGTVDAGGNNLTDSIATALKISSSEAHSIKITQGIGAGENQAKIKAAVTPILDKVITEINRMTRFYQERIKEGSKISQIVIVGGGANMPGLGDYLTDATRTPTKVTAPWGNDISFGKLSPPDSADLPRFLTCAGLALVRDEEIFGL